MVTQSSVTSLSLSLSLSLSNSHLHMRTHAQVPSHPTYLFTTKQFSEIFPSPKGQIWSFNPFSSWGVKKWQKWLQFFFLRSFFETKQVPTSLDESVFRTLIFRSRLMTSWHKILSNALPQIELYHIAWIMQATESYLKSQSSKCYFSLLNTITKLIANGSCSKQFSSIIFS